MVKNREWRLLPQAFLSWEKIGAPSAAYLECASDRAGLFECRGLEAGRHRVELDGMDEGELRATEVELTEEAVQEIEVVFNVAPPLRVEVRDFRGAPVPNAPIQFDLDARRFSKGGDRGITNEDGFLLVHALPREAP